MADHGLSIIVKLRDAASKGLKSIDRNVSGLGKTAKSAAGGLKRMYVQLAAIAAVAAGGALLGKAVKDFAAFNDNMRAAGAVMSATRSEMEDLTAAAQKMGRETRYTASQAAEALRFLGMAGFDASEAVGALPGTLTLAAAGALDLGTAADITTNVLSAFGLEVENLGRVNDVLVQTFTNSNVNLSEIGEAFKIVGPIAKSVGSDFEDLVGAIGALGNAGIKGTLAGTALKGALGALLNPTTQEAKLMKDLEGRLGGVALKVKDSEGNFVGFKKILEQLEKAGLRGDEALKLFGERAGPGMAALLNMGSKELDDLIQKLRESGGVSKDIADKMEAGVGGQIRKTVSLFESLKLKIGEALGPGTTKLLESFRGAIELVIKEVERLAEGGEIQAFANMVVTSFEFVSNVIGKAYRALRLFGALISNVAALATGDLGTIEQSVKGIADEFNLLLGNELAPKDGIVTGVITDQMVKEFEKAAKPTGPIGKGAKKVGDTIANEIVPPPATMEAKLKAALIRLNASLDTEAETLKASYNQGKISLEQYYDERAEIIKRKVEAELAILKEKLNTETDSSAREIINAQIFAKEEKLNADLVKLSAEKAKKQEKIEKDNAKAQEKINSLKLKAEKAYQDQKDRIKEGEGATSLDTKFAAELAALQTKQNDELAVIKKYHDEVIAEKRRLKATEAEIDEQYRANAAEIKEQEELQEEEKAQLVVDQQLRLNEYRLNNMKQVAAGAADIFNSIYEATGKQSKELFYLAKAAAVAEATINIAQGVTKALAQGGIFGIATGAMVAAAGAVQIGTILSQGLAEGGEVAGHSPHAKADNIPAMLTAEEFVHPVSAVRYYGKGVMEALRTKSIPRGIFGGYANGGFVKKGYANFAEGGMVSGSGKISGGIPEDKPTNIVNVLDPAVFDQYTASKPGQRNILNVMSENIFEIRSMVFDNQ